MATPVYLIASLLGLGYYLNKDGRKERVSIKRKKVSKHDKPNSKEIYNSNTVKKARRQEQRMADKLWKKSKRPIETNIIPPMFNNRKSKQQRAVSMTKQFSGIPIKQSQQKIIQKEKDIVPLSKVNNTQGWNPVVKRESQHVQKRPGFFHNNMEPFFGGSIKQNMKPDLYRTKLEHFTGAQPSYKHKKEVKRLFEPVKQNIFGNQVQKDRGLERYWISDKKPNEKPFEQIKVGPGVGLKANEKSKHGFHDSYRPKYKNVDELRVKPKVSYKGRILKGIKFVKRGKQSEVISRKPARFSENKHSNLQKKTFGGMAKSSKRENFVNNGTARSRTSKAYSGNAKSLVAKKSMAGKQRVSKKPSYKFGISNARGADESYVKGKTRTPAKAQFCIPVSNIAPKDKQSYIYNPNDIAKTTLKETIVGHNVTGGVGGQIDKFTVYDPNDLARNTVKETLVGKNITGGVGAQVNKFTVYDPNDLARNTIKETLVGKNITGGISGQVGNQTIYDPNDKPWHTGREMLLERNVTANYSGSRKKHIVYDSNERIKETIREQTGDNINQTGHVNSYNNHVNQYTDTARKTIRQQTSKNINQQGYALGNRRNQNQYTDSAKTTIRQQYEDKNYEGTVNASNKKSIVYDPNDTARQTIKQSVMTKNYVGTGSGSNEQTNRDNMYNAEINALKELTLKGRNPTQSGPKNAIGADIINMESRNIKLNPKWVIKKNLTNKCRALPKVTNIKQQYCQNQRNNPVLLSAFKKNPYTQSLSSAPILNV